MRTEPQTAVQTQIWRSSMAAGTRQLPEEVAVALTYDRVTYAVMMATPADLEDFAVGFSLSEGIVASPHEIAGIEIAALPLGLECRITLVEAQRLALEGRRRHLAGPMGCGLCGIDSLREAVRAVPVVLSAMKISASEISAGLAMVPALQRLNRQTKGIHAAALFNPATKAMLLREDVGRHNALDKVIGAATGAGWEAADCVMYLTSRVSVELIQKTAMLGAPILVAVSVPSARAVRDAEEAGITLIAVARDDGFEIFAHPERIIEACAPSRSNG